MKYPPELVEAVEAALHYGELFESPSLITSIDVLDALVAALSAAGCKIVGREPTPEMIEAGLQASPTFRVVLDSGRREHRSVDTAEIENINRAMFDAAPDVPEAWQEDATLPPPPPR